MTGEVRAQLETQIRRFDRLEARAGVLLGLAALFVVLSPRATSLWIVGARVASIVSAAFALSSFLVGDFPTLDLLRLRKKYISGDPGLTRLSLLDTHIVMLEKAHRLIHQKTRRIEVTISALFVAIALAAVALLVDNPS